MNKDRFACFYKLWIKRNAPPRVPLRVKIRGTKEYAGMVELVDSVDLGAVTSVKVSTSKETTMDDCRYTPISRFGRYSALFFYPVVGIICIAAGIWALIDSVMRGQFGSMTICCMVLASGISFLMFALSFWFYRFEGRKFLVSIEGISVSDKGKSFYRWDEVHGVTISAFAATASLQNYQTVICVFLQPETETILRKILRSYIYGARHRDKVVIIDYSPAMLDKIASVYPGAILDCRKKQ